MAIIVSPLFYVFVLQVQNMSHSIEILDQRTQRDMKFVENMEFQLKTLENKFKEVEDGHESNTARQYKVYMLMLIFLFVKLQCLVRFT